MEFVRLKAFFILQDTFLLQRSNVAGLITAELKFIFLNKFKQFIQNTICELISAWIPEIWQRIRKKQQN